MNLFPGQIDRRLFRLLDRWLAWVGRAGTARSQAGHVEWIGLLGCRVDGSHKRLDPPDILGFGACFASLPELDQLLIAAVILLENEPFPRGERWRKILTGLFHESKTRPSERELSRYAHGCFILIKTALKRLERAARKAGWL